MSDSFEDYLNEIGRYPLLTPAQEIELSRQVSAMVELRDRDDKAYTPEELRSIRVGTKAKEKMIRHNLRLVVYVTRRYWGRQKYQSLELNDFIQEGALGLDRAAEMFDYTKGYKFSTYAYWWIKQAMRRAIDNKERMIRIPVHATERTIAIKRFTEAYKKEHSRNPSFQEIASGIGTTVDWVQFLLDRTQTHASLDATMGNENETIISLIPDPQTVDRDALYEEIEEPNHHAIIESSLQLLSERERTAIILRYGLNGDCPATMQAIGDHFGISRERSRQILLTATNRLKGHARRLARQPPPHALPQADSMEAAA